MLEEKTNRLIDLKLALGTSAALLLAACAAPKPAPAPAAPPPVAVAPAPKPVAAPPAPVAPAPPPAPVWWQTIPSGRVQCDLGESFTLQNVAPGNSVEMVWQGTVQKLMHAPSSSGAYVYENSAGYKLIHIPAKMMLMNAKQGRRLADNCQ